MQISTFGNKLGRDILSPSNHLMVVLYPYEKGGQNEPFGRSLGVVRLFDFFESGVARLVNIDNERHRHGDRQKTD